MYHQVQRAIKEQELACRDVDATERGMFELFWSEVAHGSRSLSLPYTCRLSCAHPNVYPNNQRG